METKVTFLDRLNKPALEARGLSFADERMHYCDVPVFRVETWDNIVVFREGNWKDFPYKELQSAIGKGCEVVYVDYIGALNTTVIVYKNFEAPYSIFEKEIVTNGTGEEFNISICTCEYLRPPFIPVWNFEI